MAQILAGKFKLSHENCLHYFEELLAKDSEEATSFLYEYFFRLKGPLFSNWTVQLELLAISYIKIGLQLKKYQDVREVVFQYKNCTQANNCNSLQAVLACYKHEVEQLNLAKLNKWPIQQVQAVPDVEQEEAAEDLYNHDPDSNNHQIRELLINVWECYKTIFEVVKRNKKFEHWTMALNEEILSFCVKYNRRNELKHYIELIHVAFLQLCKDPADPKFPNNIDVAHSESNDQQILIRLACAKTAQSLGLWQDCLKLIEDIQLLFQLRKGTKPRQRIYTSYYQLLSELFWQSKHYSLHAWFYFNHFIGNRKNPNATKEEIVSKANKLVLSVLAILDDEQLGQQESDRITKTYSINFKALPTKAQLINSLKLNNIVSLATEPIKSLYSLLEENQSIATFASDASRALQQLKAHEYCYYAEEIVINLLNKGLLCLSKIYKNLSLDSLRQYLSFADWRTCQQVLLGSKLNIKINHWDSLVTFEEQQTQLDALQKLSRLQAELCQLKMQEGQAEEQRIAARNHLKNAAEEQSARQMLIINRRNQEALELEKSQKQQLAQLQTLGYEYQMDLQLKQKKLQQKLEQENKIKKEQLKLKRERINQIKESVRKHAQLSKHFQKEIKAVLNVPIEEVDDELVKQIQLSIKDWLERAERSKNITVFDRVDFIQREIWKQSMIAAKKAEDAQPQTEDQLELWEDPDLVAIKESTKNNQFFDVFFRQVDAEIQRQINAETAKLQQVQAELDKQTRLREQGEINSLLEPPSETSSAQQRRPEAKEEVNFELRNRSDEPPRPVQQIAQQTMQRGSNEQAQSKPTQGFWRSEQAEKVEVKPSPVVVTEQASKPKPSDEFNFRGLRQAPVQSVETKQPPRFTSSKNAAQKLVRNDEK